MKDLRKATNDAFDVAENNKKWFVNVDSDAYTVVLYEVGADYEVVWHPEHCEDGDQVEAGWWVCGARGGDERYAGVKFSDRYDSIDAAIKAI